MDDYFRQFEQRKPPAHLPYSVWRELLWQFLAVINLVMGGVVHRLALASLAELR